MDIVVGLHFFVCGHPLRYLQFPVGRAATKISSNAEIGRGHETPTKFFWVLFLFSFIFLTPALNDSLALGQDNNNTSFFHTSRHPSIGRFSRVVESNSSPNACNYVKIKHQNKNNVYPNQCISVDLYLRIKTSFICSTIQYVICRFFFTTVYHYRSSKC